MQHTDQSGRRCCLFDQSVQSKPNRDLVCVTFPTVNRRVTCFPALGTCYIFSRALGNGYVFSRVWDQLHVFPLLEPVACVPALGTGYMFSRAWHRLHDFPRLAPSMFSRESHRLPVVCNYFGLVFTFKSTTDMSFTWCILQPNLLPQRLGTT